MDLFTPRPEKKPEPKALSVTQVVRRMKNLLEIELGEFWVEGEISNLKKQASGHWYFSLKDENAQIQCAMFGARKRPGAEFLDDGVKVRAFAEPSVYEARGQLQLIVQRVERAGQGDLQAKFEALKAKLAAEGLFDIARKKTIPAFPRTVGIITSDTGAAIRDILNILERRAPWVQPVLYPVRVQGKGAELEIAKAIQRMGHPEQHGLPRCEVLIVGRGGGSIEDLWNFNEEVVARALAACPLPTISAVGHEIDFTIADFVSDLRAPTPSAAAELAVPDGEELLRRLQNLHKRLTRQTVDHVRHLDLVVAQARRSLLAHGGERILREPMLHLDHLRSRLQRAITKSCGDIEQNLRELKQRVAAQRPDLQIQTRLDLLERLRRQLDRATFQQLVQIDTRLKKAAMLLKALGPDSAFERGFSITMDSHGNIVRSISSVKPGEELLTKLKDGEIRSKTL